jgi:hypothetical protein
MLIITMRSWGYALPGRDGTPVVICRIATMFNNFNPSHSVSPIHFPRKSFSRSRKDSNNNPSLNAPLPGENA